MKFDIKGLITSYGKALALVPDQSTFRYDIFRQYDHRFLFNFNTIGYNRPFTTRAYIEFLKKNKKILDDNICSTYIKNSIDRGRTYDWLNYRNHDDLYSYDILSFCRATAIPKGYFKSVNFEKDGKRIEEWNFEKSRTIFLNQRYRKSSIYVPIENNIISNKIIRGLYTGHPMLWYSIPNIKPLNEDLGFKFMPYINYEFDSIKNPIGRLFALIKEVERLQTLDIPLICAKYSYVVSSNNQNLFDKIIKN